MRVYIVTVVDANGVEKVSQEGYTTLEKAWAFIERRSDKPKRVNAFRYRSPERSYLIYEISVV